MSEYLVMYRKSFFSFEGQDSTSEYLNFCFM